MIWNRFSVVAAGASAVAMAMAVVVGCGGGGDAPADLVLRHGQVVTMDAKDSTQEAVAVREGRIVYVGSDAGAQAWIGSSTKVIDLGGKQAEIQHSISYYRPNVARQPGQAPSKQA